MIDCVPEFTMKRRDLIIDDLRQIREDIGKAYDFDVHRNRGNGPPT